MKQCAVNGRIKGSVGEPSLLLEQINQHFEGYKTEDGGNFLYDWIYSKNFFQLWGGDFRAKEEGEVGYEAFQALEELYKNKEDRYNEQGEPKLVIVGSDAYVINYKNEKIYLDRDNSIKEQDRLDIGNAIFMSLLDGNSSTWGDFKGDTENSKEIVTHFLNTIKEELEQEIINTNNIVEEDANSDDPLFTEEDIDEITDVLIEYQQRLNAINAILNKPDVFNSIVADLSKRMVSMENKYSVEENIENQDENVDELTSRTDVSNHTKESNEVRDTSNISSEIVRLLSSVVDFTLVNGKPVDKKSAIMGDNFPMAMSANKVKNRIMETVANIVEIHHDDGTLTTSYDALIEKLKERRDEFNDEVISRFLKNLEKHTENLNEQDMFAFQVKFFEAFSKSQQNFILTEISRDSESDVPKFSITYIDPSDVQSKEGLLAKELFLDANQFVSSKPKDYIDFSEKELGKLLVKLESIATKSADGLRHFLALHGINIQYDTASLLIKNKENLRGVLSLNSNLSLDTLLDNLLYVPRKNVKKENRTRNKTINFKYKKFNEKTKKYETVSENLTTKELLSNFKDLDRAAQEEALKHLLDNKFDRPLYVLAKAEAFFRTDIADSNFNIAGKSRWKYSLMGGINKEILRWKSGNTSRLTSLENAGISYVDYLLVNDKTNNEELRKENARAINQYRKDKNLTREEAKLQLSRERIAAIEPVIFAQLRNSTETIEFKEIGESDLHLDSMFKIMNKNDEFWKILDGYSGKREEQMNNFTNKKGKTILPYPFTADKGSMTGFKGLVNDSSNTLIPGFWAIDDDGSLDLNVTAKSTIKGLIAGEFNSYIAHQNIILGYYNIPVENKQERQDYLLRNMIPNMHYTTSYTERVPAVGNNGANLTDNDGNQIYTEIKHSFNPENVDDVLPVALVNQGHWNKLGVFSSFYNNNRAMIDGMKQDFPVSDTESLKIITPAFTGFINDSKFQQALFSYMTNIINDDYDYLSSLLGDNITKLNTNIENSNTEAGVKSYLLNSMINNINLMKMFNGELGFYKQNRDSQVLTMEDFLKRGPAPGTDGLQYNITNETLIDGVKEFLSSSKERKDNFKDFNGNELPVNRNTHAVVSIVNNLDMTSQFYEAIERTLGKDTGGYGHEIADAGAYITLGFYKRTLMQIKGWTTQDEKMFNELNNPDTKLTKEHISWLKQSGKSLQPLKLVGFDNVSIAPSTEMESTSVEMPVFLKFAPAILSPAIANNTEVKALMDKMDNDGVDMVVFKSGSKASNPTTTTIHNTREVTTSKMDKDGNTITYQEFDGLNPEMKLNPFLFNLSNLKWQVELPTHYFSEDNIGTQHLKNLPANLDLTSDDKNYFHKGEWKTAKEILDAVNTAGISILKEQYRDFIKEFGLEELFTNDTFDYKNPRLRELLISQLDPSEDFVTISMLKDSNNPLETIPGVAQRLFPILSGYIKKKVGKINTNTGSVIQVANIGFDRLGTDVQNEVYFLNNKPTLSPPKPITLLDLNKKEFKNIEGVTDEMVKDFNQYRNLMIKKNPTQQNLDRLQELETKYKSHNIYYENIEVDGNTVTKASLTRTENSKMKINKAKVILPFADIQEKLGMSWNEFKALLDENKKAWEEGNNGDTFDNRILKNIISYRIPNQSISSNDSVEVVGILPPNRGDEAVVYHEITAKTGSGFGGDKLYLMIPSYNINKKDRKVSYSTRGLKGYQNDLIEGLASILESEATYDDLMSPLDSPLLKDSVYEVRLEYYNQKNPDNQIESVEDYKAYIAKDPIEQMSAVNRVKTRIDMMGAKQLVAIMANHMTHLSTTQNQNISLDFNLGFGDGDFSKKYLVGEEGNKELKLTKIVSYFMNAAVDAAKDNYIIDANFNTYTANAAMILVRSGVHTKDVFKLLLHPDIVKVSQVKQASTELTSGVKTSTYGLTAQDEIRYMKNYKNYLENNNIQTNDFDTFLETISKEDLKEDAEADRRDLLLGYWFTLVEAGKELSDEIAISKPDSTGAGKNVYEHIKILNTLDKAVRGNIGTRTDIGLVTLKGLFKDGIVKDRADYFVPEFYNPLDEDSESDFNRLTLYGAIFNNTVMLTNKIAKNMFIEASDNYRYMLNKASEILGNKLPTSETNIKELSNILYPITLSRANNLIYNRNANEQQILINTVHQSFLAIKSLKELKDNSFLNLLTYNEKRNIIEFPNYKTLDSADKNQVKEDFRKLYDIFSYDSEYRKLFANREGLRDAIARFSMQLVSYSFLANGFKPSVSSFNEFLPLAFFMDFNHAEAIDNLLNVLNNNSNLDGVFNNIIDGALTMKAHSDPMNFKYVKALKSDFGRPKIYNGRPVTDSATLKNILNPRNNRYHPFVTFKVGKERLLFKLTDTQLDEANSIVYPVYSTMSINNSYLDNKHRFLLTSLFNGKFNDNIPDYLTNFNQEHSYSTLPSLLLNSNKWEYTAPLM